MSRIILNWLPPAKIDSPSPAHSILKGYLQSNGHEVNVIYWNILLAKMQAEFLFKKDIVGIPEQDALLLFYNYLSKRYKDETTHNRIKARLIEEKPEYFNVGRNSYDTHMSIYERKLTEFLDDFFTKNDYSNVLLWGFSLSLLQWVPASIIASVIKEKYPKSVIVVGGISSRNQTIDYLKNFNQFDFGIYGEGENALLSLSNSLSTGEKEYNHIPGLIYKSENEFIVSEDQRKYVDLSSANMDFTDFFDTHEKEELIQKSQMALPLEMSRGCHWNRCHFCYLNKGYKYRVRSIQSIIETIQFNILQYSIYKYMFLDCDLVSKDISTYSHFLDELIKLKEDHPKFEVVLAEIITKELDESLIRKMSLAGIDYAQIGYESPSNELLKKIDKKNSFASNFLFIKYADKYNIKISGANVLCGLLEEKDEDILEAISNLYSMRFFLRQDGFHHDMSLLAISNRSKYYDQVKDNLSDFQADILHKYIPKNHMPYEDPNNEIFDLLKINSNFLWNRFSNTEQYYMRNTYKYKLVNKNEQSVIYREYYNGILSNELEFDTNSKDWFILNNVNSKILSYDELHNSYKELHPQEDFIDLEFINCIEELIEAGLLYASNDYSEIVSVIDIHMAL